MKVLGVTMGILLLLVVVSSTAAMHSSSSAHGPNDLSLGTCCFKFFTQRIPEAHILAIVKTRSNYVKKGFVLMTPRGKFCMSQNEKWAEKAFNSTP
nr:C-C motif chemokine 3-like [Nothobranchius furzeri]